MLKMRLQRVGRRNNPSYRIVVTDSRTGPKSNKHIDLLGSYNPQNDGVQIDGEKAKEWISKGVQVSDTMHNLLINEGVIEGKKKNVLPKKSPIAKEGGEEAAETPAAEGEEIEATEGSEDPAPASEAEIAESSESEKSDGDAGAVAPAEEPTKEESKEEEKPTEETTSTEEAPAEESNEQADAKPEETPAEEVEEKKE